MLTQHTHTHPPAGTRPSCPVCMVGKEVVGLDNDHADADTTHTHPHTHTTTHLFTTQTQGVTPEYNRIRGQPKGTRVCACVYAGMPVQSCVCSMCLCVPMCLRLHPPCTPLPHTPHSCVVVSIACLLHTSPINNHPSLIRM